MSLDDSSDDPTSINYVDHFSLRKPSSTVTYRGDQVHVYETMNEQFLIEDCGYKGDSTEEEGEARHRTIRVKRMDMINFGMTALRLSYSLVATLFVGFMFVVCFQLILFVFLNIPVSAGVTSIQDEAEADVFFGSLLSIPLFLYGMASIMSIGSAFITDCWCGGVLIRSTARSSGVVTDVLYCLLFLVIPGLAFIISSLSGSLDPWHWCSLVWVTCVGVMFCLFCAAMFFREMQACFQLISAYRNDGIYGIELVSKHKTNIIRLGLRAMLTTQTHRYCALRYERYIVEGDKEEPKSGYALSPKYEPVEVRLSLWAHMTQLVCCSWFFETLDPPIRIHSMDEIRDQLPFITSQTWNLEAMCCRSRSDRSITAITGPPALKKNQMRSTLAGVILQAIMVSLIIIGALAWVRAGTVIYIVTGIACVLCCVVPTTMRSVSMYRMYEDQQDDKRALKIAAAVEEKSAFVEDNEANNNNEEDGLKEQQQQKDKMSTMFQLWETLRVTQPKPWLAYLGILVEVGFLFVWPFASLLKVKNYPVATVFMILSIFSLFRRYFDPSAILTELGSMSRIQVDYIFPRKSEAKKKIRDLRVKYRLSEIVSKISKSGNVGRWMFVFGVFCLGIMFLALSAMGLDDVEPGERPSIVLIDDFYYEPYPDSIAYPTCEMTKGFRIPGVGNSALGDYAMFSALSYERPVVTEYILAQWFGPGEVIDEHEFVKNYRLESGTSNNPMFFKFFSFSRLPGFGIVALRGSETAWDWMVNLQLWSAAGLAQVVKWLVPYGWLWGGLLDELVLVANILENEQLKKIAYYKVSTGFINAVVQDNWGGSDFHTLRVTGASLGGGLAMISGAQTGAAAVAISGIGPELSRLTFEPPVTMDQINNRVFNWVPDRDYIARIGGRPRLNQAAECIAPPNNLFGCHSMWRSVCEILYRCGSNGRPIPCRCISSFDYPVPIQNGTRTFQEACSEEEDAFLAATGSGRDRIYNTTSVTSTDSKN